jgi:dienelactone hydrolase
MDLRLHGRDHQLAAKLLLPPETADRRPGIMFVHGWGSSQRQDVGRGKQLAARGYVCLTFNLTGHARTRRHVERVTRADNLRDTIAAYDTLVDRPEVDPDRVALVGASYGGYLAVLLTAERKVGCLALQAPAIYKDADFDRPKRELNLDPELPAYRRRVLSPAENRALACAARFGGDVLLVESEHDTVNPRQVVLNYRAAFTAARSVTHEVVTGADHALATKEWRARYSGILVDWISGHL